MTDFTKNWTKEKQSKCYEKWYKNNKEKRKEYIKNWRNKNKKRLKEYNKERYNKKIKKAWNLVRGVVIPQNKMCQNCNKEKAIMKHHPDYNNPKGVLFVCQSCNQKLPHIQPT